MPVGAAHEIYRDPTASKTTVYAGLDTNSDHMYSSNILKSLIFVNATHLNNILFRYFLRACHDTET